MTYRAIYQGLFDTISYSGTPVDEARNIVEPAATLAEADAPATITMLNN